MGVGEVAVRTRTAEDDVLELVHLRLLVADGVFECGDLVPHGDLVGKIISKYY